MTRIALTLLLATLVSSCGPSARPHDATGTPKVSARKCPDPDLRDKHDPCSPMYLHRQKPRFTRDSL